MATGLKHPGYIVHGVSGFRDAWASSFGRQEGDHQRVLVASPGAGHINSTPISLPRAQAHEPIWLQVELRCRPAMCPEIKEKTLVTSHLVPHKASSTIVPGSQAASNCPQEWPSYEGSSWRRESNEMALMIPSSKYPDNLPIPCQQASWEAGFCTLPEISSHRGQLFLN